MNNKIFYIVALIIVISVLFLLFRPTKSSSPNTATKTETTYSPGNTQQLYKPGKDSVTTQTESLHEKVILRSSAEDSSYSFTKSDSCYNLLVNLKPDSTGNLFMDYFLDITTKNLVRIDTIFQTRIDTLKIKQTITERIDPPFYNTFLFGSITTALVIILIIQLIP